MESRPLFSIIIPFFRGRRGHDTLMHVLDSCLAQTGAGFEIHVVTNIPDPQVERAFWARGDKRVFLECVGARGVNSARNLGARSARGEYLLFLDDDCALPRADFLQILHSLLSRHPDYSVLGGPYQSVRPAAWKVRGYNAMANAWVARGAEGDPEVSPAQNLLGGNICLRREIFNDFAFDERIISGGDETELLRRLTAAGHFLGFAPALAVTHWADSSWEGLLVRAWRQGRARENKTIATNGSYKPFFRALMREPSLLPFSLVHFPALYLAEKAPKFARAVKKVRHQKQAKYMGREAGLVPAETDAGAVEPGNA
jgi:glycosyltransferase involved in cell wall biosynthesis